MGYWSQDRFGRSLTEDSETDMVWGDAPADILDTAIHEIDEDFVESMGRKPSRSELVAGLLFSLGGDDDRPDEAPART